ncbi:MAG: nucleotidyltransferase domain-containing protein [Lentisphaerae bacterium]|nr:nucleotidyltransferase domain-containing protein [Lentisphaerota bacterium]
MADGAEESLILGELQEALRSHYGGRLVELVLFGSRARGEAQEESDYDVLVVLEGDVSSSRERQAVGDMVYGLCAAHDVVIMCHFAAANRYNRERSPFMMNVRREGVLV